MKYRFKIMALLLLFHLLYLSVGGAEEASLRKIRTLNEEGEVKQTDNIEDMRKFIFLEQLLFSVGLEHQIDLDNRNPERLRQEFERNRISLSPGPTVSIEEKGSKWLIVDEQTYIVRKQADEISIYLRTPKPIDAKDVSPNDEVFVKAGAHLLMKYKGHNYWYGYDTHVRIGQDVPELLEGEQFVKGKGRSRGGKILVQEAGSEYYLKVEAGGKTTLYVIEGKVLARNEGTNEEKTVSKSMAIDGSLAKIDLPAKDIRDILMWRDHLKVPIGWSERVVHWAKHYWWTTPVIGTAAGIIVRAAFREPEPEPTRLNIYVESR